MSSDVVSDIPAKLAQKQKETQQQKIEREALLNEIRLLRVADTQLPINCEDVIPADVLSFTNEQLKLVLLNMKYAKSKKNAALNITGAIQSLSRLVEFFTNDTYTLQGAEDDDDLAQDLQGIMGRFVGDVPEEARIGLRLLSHLKPKNGTEIEEEPK